MRGMNGKKVQRLLKSSCILEERPSLFVQWDVDIVLFTFTERESNNSCHRLLCCVERKLVDELIDRQVDASLLLCQGHGELEDEEEVGGDEMHFWRGCLSHTATSQRGQQKTPRSRPSTAATCSHYNFVKNLIN